MPDSTPLPPDTVRSLVEVNAVEPLIELWIHGKSPHTQRYYRRTAWEFLQAVDKPLERVSLADVQGYVSELTRSGLGAASQGRTIAVVKSLFSFAHQKLGVIPVNPAAPVTLPKVRDALAERILPEAVVQAMISQEPCLRNQVLLRLLYFGGLRVSEIVELNWRSLQASEGGGQVLIFGKGGRTRVVKLPGLLWDELIRLRQGADLEAPIFASRKGKGRLSGVQVTRIVKAAARRVEGLDAKVAERVSPHWLRHAHASHALDQGAPIHLVQATLGHASVATTGRYLHARPTESSGLYLKG